MKRGKRDTVCKKILYVQYYFTITCTETILYNEIDTLPRVAILPAQPTAP